LRLLVTRPEPEASLLAERLAALGHHVLSQPLMEIVFAAEPPGLDRPTAIVVTSRNGVRGLASWRAARNWRAVPVYAVGVATGGAARDAGFADVRVAQGDAAALAAVIRADFGARRGRLLYAAARDRSTDLAAMLPGLSVATVEAYRGEAARALTEPVRRDLAAGEIDGVLLYSRRTSEIFRDLIEQAGIGGGLRGTRLYALSDQVAQPLAGLPAAGVRVAAHPDEPSLLALLDPALADPR
jgi:uroporphyrinogen-III synthase